MLAGGLAAGVLHAVGLDPVATGCFGCPDNPLLVTRAVRTPAAFDRVGFVLRRCSPGLLVAGIVVAVVAIEPARPAA